MTLRYFSWLKVVSPPLLGLMNMGVKTRSPHVLVVPMTPHCSHYTASFGVDILCHWCRSWKDRSESFFPLGTSSPGNNQHVKNSLPAAPICKMRCDFLHRWKYIVRSCGTGTQGVHQPQSQLRLERRALPCIWKDSVCVQTEPFLPKFCNILHGKHGLDHGQLPQHQSL